MEYGVCELPFVPLRQGLSHRSEMLSQLVFGETFRVLINRGEWLRIQVSYDDYEAWVNRDAVSLISESDFEILTNKTKVYSYKLCSSLLKNDNHQIQIPFGALLPDFGKSLEFSINNNNYKIEENLISDSQTTDTRELIVENAMKMLNVPYLWGGKSSFGIDCSGFSQLIYRIAGIKIPRDSGQQVSYGTAINFISESRPGDLVFFDNESRDIVHVGILIGNKKIIHASNFVRIDDIDHVGIYNTEIKKYTHNLRVIKSLI